MAMKFTEKLPDGVGCLGTATVSRAAILAYFQDPEYTDFDGVRVRMEGFHEHECIIDPAEVTRVMYADV